MKKLIVPIILAVIVGTVLYISITKNNEEKKIKDYVNNNAVELDIIANDYLKGLVDDCPEYVKEINVYKGQTTDIVEFAISDNIGFYYTSKNIPVAHKNIRTNLLELGNNKYTWDNNSSKGTIIKIRDNWYLYKVTE